MEYDPLQPDEGDPIPREGLSEFLRRVKSAGLTFEELASLYVDLRRDHALLRAGQFAAISPLRHQIDVLTKTLDQRNAAVTMWMDDYHESQGLLEEARSQRDSLAHLGWELVNELRDANKLYFVDQIPEEMVDVYDLADSLEEVLIAISRTAAVEKTESVEGS
jgi:hypothetical protein